MDRFYSWSLLIALTAGAAAVLLGGLAVLPGARPGWVRVPGPAGSVASSRVVLGLLVLGALSLLLSVVVHARWGHGPLSAEPMRLATFVAAHRAFVVSGLIIALGAVLFAGSRRKRAR